MKTKAPGEGKLSGIRGKIKGARAPGEGGIHWGIHGKSRGPEPPGRGAKGGIHGELKGARAPGEGGIRGNSWEHQGGPNLRARPPGPPPMWETPPKWLPDVCLDM